MTLRITLAVCMLFLALSAVAQSDLKAKVDAASGGDKAKLALDYTEQAAKSADNAFKQGKDAEGSAMLKDVAQYAKVASDAAMESGKHDKEVEINLRKVVNRLVDVKNARPYDQQDAVQQTIDAVDEARNNLLEAMFKKKK
jgi:hypothetical protein